MKDYKEIVSEFKASVRNAIMIGPIQDLEERLDKVLSEFEYQINELVEHHIATKLVEYYQRVEGLPDGEPIFDKDKEIDEKT